MSVIYLITNNINNKQYVGQTTEPLSVRWRKHKSDNHVGKMLISKAIKKYGPEQFYTQILSIAPVQHLNNLEQLWVILLQTTNKTIGYNITDGGNARNVGPEGILKMKNSLTGRNLSDSHRKNIGLASKRRWQNTEYKTRVSKQMSLGGTGKKLTVQHKEHISDVNKGKKLSINHREKISAGIQNYLTRHREGTL